MCTSPNSSTARLAVVAGWVIRAQNGPAMSPLASDSVHQALSSSSPVIDAPRPTAPRNFLSSHFCVSRASGFASDTAWTTAP